MGGVVRFAIFDDSEGTEDELVVAIKAALPRGSTFDEDKLRALPRRLLNPSIVPPKGSRSVGRVLGMLGKAITGNQAPLARDADCTALAARAMR